MRILRTALVALLAAAGTSAAAEACRWREPARAFPAGEAWACQAIRWADGDTLTARCGDQAEPIRIRVRGVDTVERGHPLWRASRAELRGRTMGQPIEVRPHHLSYDRVVADVIAGEANVGLAMDSAGWSKDACPRR